MKRWLASTALIWLCAGPLAQAAEPSAMEETASEAAVSVDALESAPLAAIGTLNPASGGFDHNVWNGLDAAQLHILLERLPGQYRSATAKALAERLLLTGEARLKGEKAAQYLVFEARLRQLLAMNEPEAVLELIAAMPGSYQTPAMALTAFDARLAADKLAEACTGLDAAAEQEFSADAARRRLLCLAVDGKEAEVQVLLGLMAEKQHTVPDYFQALLGAILSQTANGPKTSIPEALPALSLVDCMAFRKSGTSPALGSLIPRFPQMKAVELDCAARYLELPVLAKGYAVERLAALGQQTPEHLADTYRTLAAEPEADQPALAGVQGRARRFKELMEGDHAKALELLQDWITRQPDTGVTVVMGTVWADRAGSLWQSLPPEKVEPHFRLLGGVLVPYEPLLLAERLPATPPYNALVWMADAYRRLLAVQPIPPDPEARGLPPASPVPQAWEVKLQIIARLMGEDVPERAPLGKPSIESDKLAEASRQQRTGEVVLRTLYLIGAERPGRLPPADLDRICDALTRAGLEVEARKLAAEVLADLALELISAAP